MRECWGWCGQRRLGRGEKRKTRGEFGEWREWEEREEEDREFGWGVVFVFIFFIYFLAPYTGGAAASWERGSAQELFYHDCRSLKRLFGVADGETKKFMYVGT